MKSLNKKNTVNTFVYATVNITFLRNLYQHFVTYFKGEINIRYQNH